MLVLSGTAARTQNGAWIDRDASLDPSCTIGQGVKVFGHVQAKENVRIEPNTVIYGPARIGSGSFVGPNVTLGFPARGELKASISRGLGLHEAPRRVELIIGRDCIIRSGACAYSGVSIGDKVSLGHNVMIRENVQIGRETMIGTGVVIDGSCRIGRRVSIQTGAYLSAHCTIEDSVFLGPHAVLTNDKYAAQKKTSLLGPTIRRGASIGANSLLMQGVEIGEGSVVGAQSLVMNDVPPRMVYVGIPAKKLKKIPADWRTFLLPP